MAKDVIRAVTTTQCQSKMSKILALLVSLTLGLGGVGQAHADWGRHGGDYREHHMHRHHHRDGGWIGPAAVLAITGAVIGATVYNRYQAPAPVYYPNPVRSNEVWYYCGSSGQYYPYTNACPEGWQAVPAR